MREELGTPGAIVGSFVLAALLGGLALAIYPGWDAIGAWANRSDAPAWVQAIGAVAAIVAVWLQALLRGAAEKRARLDRRRDLNTRAAMVVRDLGFLAKKSALYAAAISTGSIKGDGGEQLSRAFGHVAMPITQLQFWDIPEQELALALQKVQLAVSQLQLAIEYEAGSVFQLLEHLDATCAMAIKTFKTSGDFVM